MKLYEYQAKKILNENKIPIPNGSVCSTEEEARDAFDSVGKGKGVILKSQVLVGGRGKAGGIRIAKSISEVANIFKELMNMNIKGFPVSKVLIEEKMEIRNEYYVGITIDPTFYKPILLISSRGGMEVETIAKESPSYEIIKLIGELGISSGLSTQLIDIIKKLYTILGNSDATLTEINPLVESSDETLIAVDARLNIDNNALFKHPEFEGFKRDFADNKETYLRGKGVDFVYIGGNVGLICAGAGMTMDLVNAMGGKAACFCDVSAGINPQSMELAMRAVSGLNDVRSILINMFGGLTRMDEVANSFIAAWQSMGGLSQPTVIRLEGTNVEEGRRIMRENGFEMFTNLYDAVQKAVDLVG